MSDTCANWTSSALFSPGPFGSQASILSIKEILAETAYLDEYRANLLQRLNVLGSATRNTPAEILTLIFQFYLSSFKSGAWFEPIYRKRAIVFAHTKDDPLPRRPSQHPHITVLSVVCRQWRKIVYNTPEFWQVAEIKIGIFSVEDKANLIRLYLANVRNTSLYLKLSATHGGFTFEPLLESDLQPIVNVISEGAEKIGWFISNVNLGDWTTLWSSRFLKLEGLQLLGKPAPSWALTERNGLQVAPWSNIPSLKHITLEGTTFNPSRERPSCVSITVLNLDLPSPDASLYLLISCPNLIEYRVRATYHQAAFNPPGVRTFKGPFVFPHMKFFGVYCAFQQPFLAAFPYICLPALEELGLGATIHDQPANIQSLLTFLGHLPSSWSALDLNEELSDSEGLIDVILTTIPIQVTKLSLLFGKTIALESALRTLKNADPALGVRMPGLRHMRFLSWGDDFDYRGHFFMPPSLRSRPIVDMLTARRDVIGRDKFTLEMETDWCSDWKGIRDQFRQEKIGVDVTICIAGITIES